MTTLRNDLITFRSEEQKLSTIETLPTSHRHNNPINLAAIATSSWTAVTHIPVILTALNVHLVDVPCHRQVWTVFCHRLAAEKLERLFLVANKSREVPIAIWIQRREVMDLLTIWFQCLPIMSAIHLKQKWLASLRCHQKRPPSTYGTMMASA
jgi:hypothetical protein